MNQQSAISDALRMRKQALQMDEMTLSQLKQKCEPEKYGATISMLEREIPALREKIKILESDLKAAQLEGK